MGINNLIKNNIKFPFYKKKAKEPVSGIVERKKNRHDLVNRDPKSTYGAYSFRYKPYPVYPEVWDGERNFGELGFPIKYRSDFRGLAIRSWQSYYSSDITQIIVGTYVDWVVGRGFDLQSQPIERLIGKDFNRDEFTKDVEVRWKVYSGSKMCSHSTMMDLHQLAYQAKMNAIIGGDCLIVERFKGVHPTYELIDTQHLQTPALSNYDSEAKSRGNKIEDGVEFDSKKNHIAYYIREEDGKTNRIKAINSKTGRRMAWLVYGKKYRIDDVRGMCLYAAVLEEMTKLSRYKEATVSSAEERAKIVYTIEHTEGSTEENPFVRNIQRSQLSGESDGTVPETARYVGDEAAEKIAQTTGNSAINMPKNSKLTTPKSDTELHFKDFFTVNFDVVCAVLRIPPEVALNKYNSNYSASRMAIKSWEHTIMLLRDEFIKEFYKPIYNFWLDIQILKGSINAQGYLTARSKKDIYILYAYKYCKFYGANVPHVDPLKEVTAERKKLGDDKTPLTSYSKATRNINEGDWEENMMDYKKEREKVKELAPEIDEMMFSGNKLKTNTVNTKEDEE